MLMTSSSSYADCTASIFIFSFFNVETSLAGSLWRSIGGLCLNERIQQQEGVSKKTVVGLARHQALFEVEGIATIIDIREKG